MNTLILIALFAGQTPDPPPVRTVSACLCGPNCPCQVGVSGLSDEQRYADTVDMVRRLGGNVVMAVGVPFPPEYVFRSGSGEFPSGFRGLADGVYDCFMLNGVPSLQRRNPVVPMNVPIYLVETVTTTSVAPAQSSECYIDSNGRMRCPYQPRK